MRRQAIIWTNAYPVHWRIYAALGGDELTAVGSFCEEKELYIDGLVQDCRNSIGNALELQQSCTKTSIYLILEITALYAIIVLNYSWSMSLVWWKWIKFLLIFLAFIHLFIFTTNQGLPIIFPFKYSILYQAFCTDIFHPTVSIISLLCYDWRCCNEVWPHIHRYKCKMFVSDVSHRMLWNCKYSALSISCSTFSLKNHKGELWGISCEFTAWTKCKLSSFFIVFNIMFFF